VSPCRTFCVVNISFTELFRWHTLGHDRVKSIVWCLTHADGYSQRGSEGNGQHRSVGAAGVRLGEGFVKK